MDGFKTSIPSNEIACVIIDCGGNAHCGVYPKMRVMMVNLIPISLSGSLMHVIKEHNFVSGVRKENIELLQENTDEIVSVHKCKPFLILLL